jgi:LAO/AO transport system kinase
VSIPDVQALGERIRAGDPRALARGLTIAERGGVHARALRQVLSGVATTAQVIGITGAPGAGKSTLTAQIVRELRRQYSRVGVLAIDPSSPLSGGSLLGDRIRMYDLAGDEGVFIRSMANRARLGGIAAATTDATMLMAAAGIDVIIIETVGAGQSDVAVADVSDTVLLVEAPGMGDEVQSIKAGLLEVADVIAVSKSDRPDAGATLQQLKALVRMVHPHDDDWAVPVVAVSAHKQLGIAELTTAVVAHADWLRQHPQARRQQHRRMMALQRAVEMQVMERIQLHVSWPQAVQQVQGAGIDIDALASSLIDQVFARQIDQ